MDTTRETRQIHYAISRRLSAGRQLELAMGMVDAGRLGEELYLRVYEMAVKKNITA